MCFYWVSFAPNCIDCLIVGDFKFKFVKNFFVLVLWEEEGREVGRTINLWDLGSCWRHGTRMDDGRLIRGRRREKHSDSNMFRCHFSTANPTQTFLGLNSTSVEKSRRRIASATARPYWIMENICRYYQYKCGHKTERIMMAETCRVRECFQ